MSGGTTSSDITAGTEGLTLSGPTYAPPIQMTEVLANFYYKGLPSRPRLVATTRSGPIRVRTGPEAYTIWKELRPLGDHPLARVWEDDLAFELHHVLNSRNVNWTSTDVVRIADVDIEEPFNFIAIWIGVEPGSLDFDDGVVVALKCREVLDRYHIQGVEVEIRESRIVKQVGSRFLDPVDAFFEFELDASKTARDPYTATLGIPMSAKNMPCAKGTGGFYISAGGNDKKIYLVTARHVVLPLDKDTKVEWKCNSASEARHDVVVFDDSAFDGKLSSIEKKIQEEELTVWRSQRRIDERAGRKDDTSRFERQLQEEIRVVKRLTDLYNDIVTGWGALDDRVFGHLVWSPPINLSEGPIQYTQDFAVIEIHAGKLDAKNYRGNAINLYSKYGFLGFQERMNPNRNSRTSFEYPFDHLMKLQGQVPERELYNPRTIDKYDEPYLMVYKNGAQSGVTIGRGNNVCSYTRNRFEGEHTVSKEWPILGDDCSPAAKFPYDVFSTKGDSGSVVGDGFGRMCGLITGGAGGLGDADYYDITYATPVESIMNVLHSTETFKHAHLNPVLPAEEGLEIDSH